MELRVFMSNFIHGCKVQSFRDSGLRFEGFRVQRFLGMKVDARCLKARGLRF